MDNNQVTNMVVKVLEGQSTTEQVGIFNRLLNTALAQDLVQGQQALIRTLSGFEEVSQKLQNAIDQKLQVEVETMELKELFEYYEKIQSYALRVLDLQRKIVQGKDLFPSDILSEEEKAFLSILKSFRTDAEKTDFVNKIKQIQAEKDAKQPTSTDTDPDTEKSDFED